MAEVIAIGKGTLLDDATNGQAFKVSVSRYAQLPDPISDKYSTLLNSFFRELAIDQNPPTIFESFLPDAEGSCTVSFKKGEEVTVRILTDGREFVFLDGTVYVD